MKAADVNEIHDEMKELLNIKDDKIYSIAWLYSEGVNNVSAEIRAKTFKINKVKDSHAGWCQDPFYQTAQEQGLDDKDFEFW